MAQFKHIIFITFAVLAVIFSGCTGGQDVTPIVKTIPEVQQFLKEHPNAKITVTYWSKEDVAKLEQEISEQCDKPITPVAMYKATISDGDLKSIAWIDAETKTVICSTTEGKGGTTPTPVQTSTPVATETPEITSTPTAIPTPTATPTPTLTSTITATPTSTATSTPVPTPSQDSFDLKNGYRLKLAKVEGMNEVRAPDGTWTVSRGTNVRIVLQLLQAGKIVNEQTVPDGAAFSLYDEEKIIAKANFRALFLGVASYAIKLENLVQYDKDSGGVILTRDVVTLILPYT